MGDRIRYGQWTVSFSYRHNTHYDLRLSIFLEQAIADLADVFLVWESRREDDTWAIWTIKLDGEAVARFVTDSCRHPTAR
jgi:hypothetical protein